MKCISFNIFSHDLYIPMHHLLLDSSQILMLYWLLANSFMGLLSGACLDQDAFTNSLLLHNLAHGQLLDYFLSLFAYII